MYTMYLIGLIQIFQSTLPRRERRTRRSSISICCMISIHAPAEGATCQDALMDEQIVISIHAPAEGATIVQKILSMQNRNFNPRSRGGSDYPGRIKGVNRTISIHAPAEGATANIHNFFGVISEQNVHICIFSYIISFSRRINNHINKEINEFSGANRLGIYGCFIFARIFMKFLITAQCISRCLLFIMLNGIIIKRDTKRSCHPTLSIFKL